MKQFKDPIGRWFTTGMFKETSDNPKYVIYTLEEAKQLYLECGDITGYTFATQHLGGWRHWLALHNSPKLEPLLKEWEEELEVRLRSSAVKQIIDLSRGEKGYQAAKYLADRGWKVRDAGRPSKAEIQKETKTQSKMYEEFQDNIVSLKK